MIIFEDKKKNLSGRFFLGMELPKRDFMTLSFLHIKQIDYKLLRQSWLWTSSLGFLVTSGKCFWVSYSLTFSCWPFRLTQIGSLRGSLNSSWRVDGGDWSSESRQERRKEWSVGLWTILKNPNAKPCPIQLKVGLLRHCSSGDIYSSVYLLYLLIIRVQHIFHYYLNLQIHHFLRGTCLDRMEFFQLIGHSQETTLEVKSIQILITTPWTILYPRVLTVTRFATLSQSVLQI